MSHEKMLRRAAALSVRGLVSPADFARVRDAAIDPRPEPPYTLGWYTTTLGDRLYGWHHTRPQDAANAPGL